MKARVLVLKVDDGEQYTTLHTLADEFTMDNNSEWLAYEVVKVKEQYGTDLVTHGFIDIEIPDAMIESVTRQHADAGPVDAQEVQP